MEPKVATGLYSHWDSFIKVDKKVLNWIRNSKKTKPVGEINSLREAVYTLDEAIKKGGREFLISEKVYKELDSLFPNRKMMLGGNGNNMGRTLFSLGMNPLVSYPLRPESLMKASPKFRVALEEKIVAPEMAIRNDPEYKHIIFEFKNDRHILTWNPAEREGIFDKYFLKFACNKKFTDILVLAYAHLLLPKYKKRTDMIIDELKNRPKVHLEFGTGSKTSMKYAIERFAEKDYCDSFGMDEKECKIYFKASSEKEEDLIEVCMNAINEYKVKRICVHSPSFVFSISEYDSKKEANALKEACIVASKLTGINPIIESFERKIGKYNLSVIKNKINPKPQMLTGLGDAFAAVQAVRSLL